MRENVSCVITGKTLAELESDDFLVSLDAENFADGSARHYYSYSFLLEWYIRRYRAGHSLVTLSTQNPQALPQARIGIIPAEAIQKFDLFRHGFFAVIMLCNVYSKVSSNKLCSRFSEVLIEFSQQKAAALAVYNANGGEFELQQRVDQINTQETAFVNYCAEIFKNQSFQRSVLDILTGLYFAALFTVYALRGISKICQKDPDLVVREWLDARVTRYNPPEPDNGVVAGLRNRR